MSQTKTSPRPPLTRQQVVDAARIVCTNHRKHAEWSASWNRVLDQVRPALTKRKGLRSFEAHHLIETARETFLRCAVEGEALRDCENRAVESVVRT